MSGCDIGLIGLAVIGENLVLNMESKGFHVAVYNRTTEVTDKFAEGRASYRTARLPQNLLQAQRDFFGAHTFERLDKPEGEFFHNDWF